MKEYKKGTENFFHHKFTKNERVNNEFALKNINKKKKKSVKMRH